VKYMQKEKRDEKLGGQKGREKRIKCRPIRKK
jgi:hypothetical protein